MVWSEGHAPIYLHTYTMSAKPYAETVHPISRSVGDGLHACGCLSSVVCAGELMVRQRAFRFKSLFGWSLMICGARMGCTTDERFAGEARTKTVQPRSRWHVPTTVCPFIHPSTRLSSPSWKQKRNRLIDIHFPKSTVVSSFAAMLGPAVAATANLAVCHRPWQAEQRPHWLRRRMPGNTC